MIYGLKYGLEIKAMEMKWGNCMRSIILSISLYKCANLEIIYRGQRQGTDYLQWP